jgi:hypothetical protein
MTIMVIDKASVGEFNTLVFTYTNDRGDMRSTMTMSIECSYFANGVWEDSNDSLFEEPELKEVINSHMHNWTPDILSAYKTNYITNHPEINSVPVNAITDEIITTVLNSL